jgi:diguanylate cyclase (GGDEF)-like protein
MQAMPSVFWRLLWTLGAALCAGLLAAPAASAAESRLAELLDLAAQNPWQASREAKALLAQTEGQNRPEDQLAALIALADTTMRLEQADELLAYATRGFALAEQRQDRGAMARFLCAQAYERLIRGDGKGAWALHGRALAMANSQDDLAVRAVIYEFYGMGALYLNYLSDGLEYALQAVTLYTAHGPAYRLSETLHVVGDIHDKLGNTDQALRYYAEAEKLLPPGRYAFEEAVNAYNVAVTYMKRKESARAKEKLMHSLRMSAELNDEQTIGFVRYRLAILANEAGAPEEAESHIRAVQPFFDRLGRAQMQLASTLVLAKSYTMRKNPQALELLKKADPLQRNLTEDMQVQYHLQAAETQAAFGNTRAAYDHMQTAFQANQRVFESLSNQGLQEQLVRFQTQRKDAENALLRKEQLLQRALLAQATNERERMVLWLVVAALAAGAIVYALIQQARQRRQLAVLAMRDELTGVPNRRGILTYAERQFADAASRRIPVSFAILDLDFFKRVNDNYGHAAGDQVLCAFAQACTAVLRREDQLGRWGGEEWLLILPGLDAQGVRGVFARLQAAMHGLQVPGLPAEVRISFSMGAAVMAGTERPLLQLLNAADEALYEAKAAGRDCLRVADLPAAPQATPQATAPAEDVATAAAPSILRKTA